MNGAVCEDAFDFWWNVIDSAKLPDEPPKAIPEAVPKASLFPSILYLSEKNMYKSYFSARHSEWCSQTRYKESALIFDLMFT